MLQDDARRMELVLDSLAVRNRDASAAALASTAQMGTDGLVVRQAAATGRQPEVGHRDRTDDSAADPASCRPRSRMTSPNLGGRLAMLPNARASEVRARILSVTRAAGEIVASRKKTKGTEPARRPVGGKR
jgi:hypothetical protein